MCRHLAYLGPPIPLSALLFDPLHALARQSWAPADMRGGGSVNADGFGVGWFPEPGAAVVYRRQTPIWSDTTLPGLAAVTQVTAVLAAIRNGTTGMPVSEGAVAPFAEGRWLFSHNGVVAGWPGSVAKLAAALPVEDLLTLPAPTDSALLWVLVRDRLRRGMPAPEALTEVVADVNAVAPGSRLNLLLTDGRTVAATTQTHALAVRHDPGATLVSSEPLDDDPAWQPVPDRTLLTATPSGLTLTPLGEL